MKRLIGCFLATAVLISPVKALAYSQSSIGKDFSEITFDPKTPPYTITANSCKEYKNKIFETLNTIPVFKKFKVHVISIEMQKSTLDYGMVNCWGKVTVSDGAKLGFAAEVLTFMGTLEVSLGVYRIQ